MPDQTANLAIKVEISAAIVDRVTFNAHILETGTQSYRLRITKSPARRKRAT